MGLLFLRLQLPTAGTKGVCVCGGEREREKEWLMKIRREEEPQFKAGSEADCGKDSLTFDLVTRLKC